MTDEVEAALLDRIAELEERLRATVAETEAILEATAARKAATAEERRAALERQASELAYEMFCDERRRMCQLFAHGGSCGTHSLTWRPP
jgi:hypothetical protein